MIENADAVSHKIGQVEYGAETQFKQSRHYITAGLASMIGTTIEWYDFFIYGTAAALVFNKIFFPAIDPVTGTLAAFGTYSVGFVARPLGGLIFGHFGDRVGRKSMLIISLLLMGIPTILVGLTPSYESIGYWSAVALVLFRFMQGLAVGGEWGGAVLMAVEHAPEGRKGFFGSLPQTGVAPGLILSSVAMGLVSRLPEKEMLSWGWRIPFLASVILLVVGWYIRAKVQESPEFQAGKSKTTSAEMPVKKILRDYNKQVLLSLIACVSEKTWFYTVATFSLTYAVTTLGLSRDLILSGVIWGAAVTLFTIPLFGYLGDKIGRKLVFVIGGLGVSAFAAVFFQLLSYSTAFHINAAMVIAFGLVYAAMYAQEASLFASQFPAEVRYTGISLAVQIGGAIGGGTAPIVATYLLSLGGGKPYLITCYLAGLGLVAAVCGSMMRTHEEELAVVSKSVVADAASAR
jgi:MHS family shikimate/dehydroshikimate transporter-like MFS transporter